MKTNNQWESWYLSEEYKNSPEGRQDELNNKIFALKMEFHKSVMMPFAEFMETKAFGYVLGFLIALFCVALMFGCTKAPMAKPSIKSVSLTDTLNFHIYACQFDSIPSLVYNKIIIKVSGTKDSIVIKLGVDYAHTYKGVLLDTTTNKKMDVNEDSTFVKLAILKAGDTIKYIMMNTLSKAHIATFVVTPGYVFTRIWENTLFYPYGNSGVHISSGYVNDIYIP